MNRAEMPLGLSPFLTASLMLRSIAEAISSGAVRLAGIVDNPRLESRILLAHALGLTQNDLIRNPAQRVDTITFNVLVARRAAREPAALIVGQREFWSLPFRVSPATLIPRPDSETLVEAVLATFSKRRPPRRILDLGTGTGCLLLALLSEYPSAFGIGIDLEPDAAALGKFNATQLGFADRTAFLVGNWMDAIAGRFDLIVCNPPYIPVADIDTLMPEVRDHEPTLALDGGVDGYDAYRAILPALKHNLEPRGAAVLELGIRQATYVTDLARKAELVSSLRLDLAEIPRVMVLTLPGR